MIRPRRRSVLGGLALPFAAPALAMAAESAPPFGVQTLEPIWIPLRDGVKLAGRLWLPRGRPGERFPVVLEYIPYRTFDRYRGLDDRWGEILASRGIAFARVDIRGSGNSEGVLEDEYLESEQADGVEIIAWLAAQTWSNGSVGMRGLSWGGFSTLQVAARRPPALKAIVPMCATDMRFRNDAHYVGGLPGLTNLKWAAGFELVMSSPPDPQVVGDRWEALWKRRLEATPSIAARWLKHDANDAYWRHGSVGLDPAAIQCPAYIVDGWADAYAQSAERLLRALPAPSKAIFGPWGHSYPDLAQPGPGLDWASEETRWWRRWLAGAPAAAEPDPRIRFFIDYATPAETGMQNIPGRWAAEAQWPAPAIRPLDLRLAPGRLVEAPAAGRLNYRAGKVVGLATPEWIPYAPAELPRSQQADDARSLVFDRPVEVPTEIVGTPRLKLRIAADRPVAAIAARLCEVDRDGRSWLVSYGVLNLCFHRGFEADPERLTPGAFYDVDVALEPIAHRFKPGSTLRLALSDNLWPLTWPSPEPVTFEVDLGGCTLSLPVRPIPEAEASFPIAAHDSASSRGDPTLDIREASDGSIHVQGGWPTSSQTVAATGAELSSGGPDMELSYDPADRASCRWRVTQTSKYRRDGWDCEMRVEINITATGTQFLIEDTLMALKDGKPFFSRTHRDQVARQYS
ncbi:CocE/NonD family hydrolase [Phenylobacterium sp.]|uniref:CocE/NonD family hydrolase n=1 Tax=Phenylobacterium sp. TaxID=1871053 RepID=UPI0025FEFC57|nr:CocE/NonD family hydrolase [Phenylobacterium sp.]